MHDVFQRLEGLTASFVERLDEATFEDIERFMQERSYLIEEISQLDLHGDLRQAAGDTVRKIIANDPIITSKMEQLRDEAAQGLSKMSAARLQRNAYDSGDDFNQSHFIDRKN